VSLRSNTQPLADNLAYYPLCQIVPAYIRDLCGRGPLRSFSLIRPGAPSGPESTAAVALRSMSSLSFGQIERSFGHIP